MLRIKHHSCFGPTAATTKPLLAGLHNGRTPQPMTLHSDGMRCRQGDMSMKAPCRASIPASEVPVSNQVRGPGDPEACP